MLSIGKISPERWIIGTIAPNAAAIIACCWFCTSVETPPPGASRHQTRFTPYSAKTGSAVTTASSPSSACATRSRSNGSRW